MAKTFSIKKLQILTRKKKPATITCLEADIQWALSQDIDNFHDDPLDDSHVADNSSFDMDNFSGKNDLPHQESSSSADNCHNDPLDDGHVSDEDSCFHKYNFSRRKDFPRKDSNSSADNFPYDPLDDSHVAEEDSSFDMDHFSGKDSPHQESNSSADNNCHNDPLDDSHVSDKDSSFDTYNFSRKKDFSCQDRNSSVDNIHDDPLADSHVADNSSFDMDNFSGKNDLPHQESNSSADNFHNDPLDDSHVAEEDSSFDMDHFSGKDSPHQESNSSADNNCHNDPLDDSHVSDKDSSFDTYNFSRKKDFSCQDRNSSVDNIHDDPLADSHISDEDSSFDKYNFSRKKDFSCRDRNSSVDDNFHNNDTLDDSHVSVEDSSFDKDNFSRKKDLSLKDSNSSAVRFHNDTSDDSHVSEDSIFDKDNSQPNSDDENPFDLPPKLPDFDEADIVRDLRMPNVFILKYRKSKVCSKAQSLKKKNERVYDNYHACLYCGEFRQHIGVHMKVHSDIGTVRNKLMLSSPDFTVERKKGDHNNNKRCVEKGEGLVILSRRSDTNILDISTYGPCPYCFEWLKLKNIKDHCRKCNSSSTNFTKGQLQTRSQVLAGFIKSSPSKLMLTEVFPSMQCDTISHVAKSDRLIIALGESVLRNSIDNHAKRRYYASQRMRLMARLLINLRSLTPRTSKNHFFVDYLKTNNFDFIVKAALNCSLPNMDDFEDLMSPSNAIKIKYDLRRMVDANWALLVKEDPLSEDAKHMETIQKLISLEWGERLTKLARAVLLRRKFHAKKEIPSPQDITVLTTHLIEELKNTERIPGNYMRLVQLVLTRLLMFNRRRSGEVESASLVSYTARAKQLSDIDESLVGELSEVENYLLKTNDLMTIRGKGSRPVPVIIPADVKEPLAYIASREARTNVGISRGNNYLFPNAGSGSARAYECLKKTCCECDLQAPARITSVSIRKYTATLTQMYGLDSHQMEWVYRHLGHTKSVHHTHYKQMSGMIERVYLSKLFLIQDMNLTHKFKNRHISQLDISDILFPENNEDPPSLLNKENNEDPPSLLNSEEGEEFSSAELHNIEAAYEGEDEDISFSDEDLCTSKQMPVASKNQKPKTKRQKFSEKESEEIKEYFMEYLNSKVTPRSREVKKAQLKSRKCNGEIWKRSIDKIIKKISALNHKDMPRKSHK